MITHTTTFTAAGIAPWTPVLVHGDAHKRQARAVVHELLAASTPAVSFLPTIARAGRLDILAANPASAAAGMALFSAAKPITLADATRPDLAMRFVVVGDVTQQTDTDTQECVLLTVQFQEVPL